MRLLEKCFASYSDRKIYDACSEQCGFFGKQTNVENDKVVKNDGVVEKVCRKAIFVRVLDGKTMVIPLDEGLATIGDVKKKVHVRTGISCRDQRLTFMGKEMTKDDTHLLEYGIGDQSSLDLNVRLRGGIDGMTIMVFAILGAIALWACKFPTLLALSALR